MSELIKLRELQELLSEEECDLSPAITHNEVMQFEKDHHISLPEEYIAFLTNIAEGGEIRSIGEIIPIRDIKISASQIIEPFPYTRPWNWALDGYDIDSIDKSSGSKYDAISKGTMTLFDEGDGGTWFLVVTGQCKGEMWHKCDFGIQPTDKRLGFLEWLLYMLRGISFWD